ncbi:MAG: PIN domain-containing protein [Thermoproteota archaeon]|nr:PIN domain-containing protein [Thermoproteota archaeon]
MTYNYIIDSYAWIEYFKASKFGENAKKYIESKQAATPTIVIAEVSRKLQKEINLGNETSEGRLKRLEFIKATSQIVNLDFETAAEAGKTNLDLNRQAKGWGLADSIILCTAKNAKAKVVTGDEHFRDLVETIFIKK